MSTTVTTVTTVAIQSNPFGGLFSFGGAASIVLLILLLLQKDLFRVLGRSYATRTRALDALIGPLLLVLGFAALVRILSLL